MSMQIQDKVSWNGEVDQQLALLGTLGLDCIAIDLPDIAARKSGDGFIDARIR
jgi:hypothetical protein